MGLIGRKETLPGLEAEAVAGSGLLPELEEELVQRDAEVELRSE